MVTQFATRGPNKGSCQESRKGCAKKAQGFRFLRTFTPPQSNNFHIFFLNRGMFFDGREFHSLEPVNLTQASARGEVFHSKYADIHGASRNHGKYSQACERFELMVSSGGLVTRFMFQNVPFRAYKGNHQSFQKGRIN